MDPIERVRLGSTDVEVTRLGLGTAPLGGMFAAVSGEEAERTVRRAHELGWRFVDTAPLYGYGLAEQRVGRVLRTLPRGEMSVSTKVGRLLRPVTETDRPGERIFKDAPALMPHFDFSADGVVRSLRSSLERLGTDRVDVLHVHDPDDHGDEALASAFPALTRLRAEGTIAAVGAGMNQTAMLCRFAREADVDCFLCAGRYTLLDPSAADELLPLCAERGIAVICGGVYNSGVLAAGRTYDYVPASADVRERARRIEAVCGRHGVPLKAAAIQFPLSHPAVMCVVVGARSPEEVDENDRMFRHEIPPALWSDLRDEGLIPGSVAVPGGR